MSDPRFARLRTDPRFRRIKKDKNKVVVDERFKDIFDDKSKKKSKKDGARVDKYGRPLAEDHEQENLRRFYRLEDEEEAQLELKPGPDYARGAVLLESSDEEDDRPTGAQSDDDSDTGGIITLGRDVNQPIPVPDESAEVDLDEDTYAELDAQAAAYAKANQEADQDSQVQPTRRIAVVNLDWDHVRAIHLYKIFSSLVSPTGAPVASGSKDNGSSKARSVTQVRGKVLSVRVYPSEFGKERMAREEKEGPPPEVFKKRDLKPEEINERTVYEVGDGEDYDEEALRKYQLERLRYYYAIVECDTVEAASHIFNELEGTELERSANVFDLSYVPDDMTFDDEFRDEATDDLSAPYRPLEFVTDALRHSKVKLTWDEDEPERTQVTRRTFTRKEIEENDFRAYIASSSDEDEDDAGPSAGKSKKAAERDKLRALLLSGGDDTMPEGWGESKDDDSDVDMEITFTPGLSAAKDEKDETTLEKYQRKMREKKKKRKEELRERTKEGGVEKKGATKDLGDDFFVADSEDEGSAGDTEDEVPRGKKGKGKVSAKKGKGRKAGGDDEERAARVESTAEELALLAASDNPNGEVKHFDMKAVLRAEKKKGRKKKGKKGKKGADDGENEIQEDFSIDVKDDRFKAVLEDHTFAIDPSNPHFKKTKSMAALLDERSRRQQEKASKNRDSTVAKHSDADPQQQSLQSLVESVKRKSAVLDEPGIGKRRKLT
ncbi:hypothetical protein K466DRAFT_536116 [Polyporus arcularius HHB13444]|uniref:Uncharacterized protein n=1 Tax=Polyporus arcularius HHB13444 TaxID=1314778 RepID=A0A5C3Q089_9APHY|nr:hypothetical protein K466DRAFT_536116 [Polyporus arcularius HHB13444]